jgi:hypothetical protein
MDDAYNIVLDFPKGQKGFKSNKAKSDKNDVKVAKTRTSKK